ncbi:RNA polymerase sigma factor [Alteromonas oceanisediminis]|uniref:RNA polymerase sigma factor n=1 Tax=Alteromonas oceanisediminis TaxID=2836180 RepID=UPI001BDACB3A|nr:RNA polymerase sigma factor [Alteromonas oceanisediminis]MBT0586919.1 RNA polymerase sigma factor [Alteromonas oceanisediminis]
MVEQPGNIVEAQQRFASRKDIDVIAAAQQGDKAAYKQLYETYVGRVYALCLRLTGERTMAEDATQEVFIQLWRKLSNYNGQSQFTTWLHSVTSNIAISYIRKQKGWFQRTFNIEDSPVMDDSDAGSAGDVELDRYILRLPERARHVFVLHAIEGYRHEEIADLLNMAVGSSKAQFHRAKQLLTEWMDDE